MASSSASVNAANSVQEILQNARFGSLLENSVVRILILSQFVAVYLTNSCCHWLLQPLGTMSEFVPVWNWKISHRHKLRKMFQLPDYTNVSVALSEVLAEVGLKEEIVNERRRTCLVTETMYTITFRMTGSNERMYIFGSQSEGTTTRHLYSDFDMVVCDYNMNVIQEWKDWKQGECNLMLVEADGTPPGYCKLQFLRPDIPVPLTEIKLENCFKDRQGRIFLINTLYMSLRDEYDEHHGPAFSTRGRNGTLASDIVPAYVCTSQLSVVQHWLSQLHGQWPSEDMKRDIASSPCLVVPVGVRESAYQALEFRISTSLAERCLMFSLNVTQLQVYVLMKMLLKICINYNVPGESRISSFMCKTVVLHCVLNTDPNAWQSHMLVQCLLFSLFTLYACVVNENCPHFIIRSNNLMAGRFTQQAKYQLQQNLQWLFDDIISRGILSLLFDDIASRLVLKLTSVMSGTRCQASVEVNHIICCSLRMSCAQITVEAVQSVLKRLKENRLRLIASVLRLQHVCMDGNTIERSAYRLLRPYFYTTLGSLLASESIQNSGIISSPAYAFFFLGQNSDVASSRLKLASACFCAGDMETAEITLRDLEGRYNTSVCAPVCPCTNFPRLIVMTRNEACSPASDESDIPKMTSSCVFFTQAEKYCTPQELHYEMYRSTRQDLLHRRELDDDWMDWAVVDSFPYLHFLCYKVYGRLERYTDQQRALENLMMAIQTEPNLGHRETALNLLGQCMEQEDMWNYALQCYRWSLNIHPKNNAATFHICRLLFMRYRQ